MPKKPVKTRNKPAKDAPEEVLDPQTPEEFAPEDVTELVDGEETIDEGEEYLDEFPPEEETPKPKPRNKGGRPKNKPREDSGPFSLADLVNASDANDAWWQEHRLVIYRKDISKDMKALMKADSGRTWIDRISGPFSQEEFDESYLRSHYGGGLFSVFLQEKPTGGNKWNALMEAEYVIAGPPKYTDEEAAAARRANPNQNPVASPGGGERGGDTSALIELLQRQIERAEAPQAQALASFADTIRTGQQASTEMLMASMRQVIEMRGQPGGQNDKLVEMLMGMILEQTKSKPAEPQKTGLDQLREMLELQKIVASLQPRREPGPFDDVAKALMLKAAETVVPDAAGAIAGTASGGGGSWIKDLVGPLIPQLPALITGVGAFFAQQQRARREQLQEEFRMRAALIDRQRGVAPQPGQPEQIAAPAPAALSPEEQAAQQMQMQEAAQGAAQMDLFINALTSMFFGGEPAEDAAITLSTAFPQVVMGLRTQLAPYGDWWGNALVMGHLRNTYPGLKPCLTDPRFPAWIGEVWKELSGPQIEPETPENEGAI